ncbi:hypothetical protein LPJ61_002476, partial [Coemansia biformis]
MQKAASQESLQELCLAEDNVDIAIRGYVASGAGRLAYWAAVVATAGGLYVVSRWLPAVYIYMARRPAPLALADYVQVLVDGKHASIEPVSISGWDGGLDFVYCSALGQYVCTSRWKDPAWASGSVTGHAGLSGGAVEQRALLFGQCTIDIREKSYLQLLWDEALNPFYIFQIASIAVWCSEAYYYYSGVIFAISALSIAVTVITTKRTVRRIRDMSAYVCTASVLRANQWCAVPSSGLVPGDIIDISGLDQPVLPCDAVLLEGDCIVDESMLTGECIPESKAPLVCGDGVLEALD